MENPKKTKGDASGGDPELRERYKWRLMYRVEYTYPDYVQHLINLLDERIKQEREIFNKNTELMKGYKRELRAFNLQQVIKEHENKIAPLYEAKNRILSNAIPLKITIIED